MPDLRRVHIDDLDRDEMLAHASNPLEALYYRHEGRIAYKWHHYLEVYDRHLARFRGDSRFSTWLIQIVINEARMKRRKERKHLYDSIDESQNSDDKDYLPQDLADWREIPSEALQQKELRDALRRAIDALSPIYRQVFMLRDVQQMSIAETAAALGITEASVKTRLLRARLQVRDALAPGYDGKWTGNDGHWSKVRPW